MPETRAAPGTRCRSCTQSFSHLFLLPWRFIHQCDPRLHHCSTSELALEAGSQHPSGGTEGEVTEPMGLDRDSKSQRDLLSKQFPSVPSGFLLWFTDFESFVLVAHTFPCSMLHTGYIFKPCISEMECLVS